MTDRELLEAAAKAAGIEGAYFHSDNPMHQGIYQARGEYYWNPLYSDSEALRLAVKLRIVVNLAACECCAVVDWPDNEDGNEIMVRFGEDYPDREAADALDATRRAIVRAAAEIWRAAAAIGERGVE